MNSSKRSSEEDLKVIVDTNIIFSAIIYPDGKENALFQLADEGKLKIIICDYVIDEAKAILERKMIKPVLLINFLDTFRNLHIEDIGDLKEEEIELAIETISDEKDRPIFIFAYRLIRSSENIYLVTGDSDLRTKEVNKELKNRSITTGELLSLL